MSDELDIYYWDACIFYEHLNQEPVDVYMKQAIDDILEANRRKANKVCTSAITHLEVLPSKLASQKEVAYWGFFTTEFFYDIELDRNIVALARELRNFYYQPSIVDIKTGKVEQNHKLMGPGDALHLATAIIQGVTEFHTRDKKRKSGNIPLLGLPEMSPGGKICGKYELRIVSPITNSPRLGLEVPDRHRQATPAEETKSVASSPAEADDVSDAQEHDRAEKSDEEDAG